MTNEQQQKQKHILLLSLLIGFALRIFQLDRQSLWFDDIITVHLARMPIIAGLDGLIGQGIQLTPLFHWMVKAWMILGDSEWVLRFLPVCISLMTIPLMFHLGRAYGSSSVGLLAAVIFAINPYQIWYAHELRIYSLLTFAAVGAMLTFQRMLKGAGAANTIAFIIFNALGFASHHFMFLLPTIQFIFFLRYFRRYYAHFRKWMLINIISGSVLLPWFGYIFYRGQFNFGIGWIPKPTLLDLPYTIWNFTLGYREDPPLLLTGAFTLILAILIWGFFSVRSLRPYHFLLRIWLIFPLIIVWLFSQGGSSSFYVDRYFLVVAPVVTLLIAFGIQSLPSPWLKTSVAGL
ncbi:MAG: glycosyltransferase family 39 protein, partial [Chloroflexota bacterium]